MKRHKKIIASIGSIPKSACILDTSCGDGMFLKMLAEENNLPHKNLYGIDIDYNSILEARENAPNIHFEVAENTEIPFKNNKFDIVVSAFTLHHMRNPENFLESTFQVLARGAYLLLVDVVSHNTFSESIFKYCKCPEPYHFEKIFSEKDIHRMSQVANLQIGTMMKKIFYAPLIVPFVFSIFTIFKIKKVYE